MNYIIVTWEKSVVGKPFTTFGAAFIEATRLFGDEVGDWLKLNLRIEENR